MAPPIRSICTGQSQHQFEVRASCDVCPPCTCYNRYKYQNQQTMSLLGKHSAAFNVIRLKQVAALLAHYQGLVHNKYKKFYIKHNRRVYKCENMVSDFPICICMCMYICICICVCVYIYIYIYIFIYLFISITFL
jgi:hypothetical protein